jgi:hypothetical protein
MEKYARENSELARRVFLLSERGYSVELIAQAVQVSVPTALNLIGIGRRLVAGEAAGVVAPRGGGKRRNRK